MSYIGPLKQSTAVDVLIGPFVDDINGNTEETALTIAQADVRLSKNGQTGAQKSDVTTCVHDADGMYNCELDATDTNTVGQLTLWVHVVGALFVRHDLQVIEEAIYDALYGASAAGFDANQRVDVGSWLGGAIPAQTQTGVPEVDVTHQVGGLVPTPFTTGIPDVNLAEWLDSIPAALVSTLVNCFVTDAAAALKRELGVTLASGTAQVSAAGTLVLAASSTFANDELNGNVARIVGGTGVGQARIITDYVGATDTATVTPNWITTPDATSVYEIVEGSVNVEAVSNVADDIATETTVAAIPTTDIATELKASGLVLHKAVIETVTSQTQFVIPATDDAVDDDAYNGATAIIIDGTDSNQISFRQVTDYVASTRTVTIDSAADFTVTNADTLCLLPTIDMMIVPGGKLLTDPTGNVSADVIAWLGSGPLPLVDSRVPATALGLIGASGLVNDGTPTVGGFTVSGITAAANAWQGSTLVFTFGSLSGESRIISSQGGGGNLDLTFDRAWRIAPADTNSFVILSPLAGVLNRLASVVAATGFIDSDVQAWLGAAVTAADLISGIKKNTALSNFPLFQTDITDHVTGLTGITFAASESQRSIDGAAFANTTNVPTEVANGAYKVNLSAADLNGDTIILKFTGTGADPTFIMIKTTN